MAPASWEISNALCPLIADVPASKQTVELAHVSAETDVSPDGGAVDAFHVSAESSETNDLDGPTATHSLAVGHATKSSDAVIGPVTPGCDTTVDHDTGPVLVELAAGAIDASARVIDMTTVSRPPVRKALAGTFRD